MDIPPAAVSPFEEQKGAFLKAKVPEDLPGVRILKYRPRWYRYHHVFPIAAVTLRALSVPAISGFETLFEPQMGQGTQIMADLKDHRPSPAAVAS
jgi:hypothetical protein